MDELYYLIGARALSSSNQGRTTGPMFIAFRELMSATELRIARAIHLAHAAAADVRQDVIPAKPRTGSKRQFLIPNS